MDKSLPSVEEALKRYWGYDQFRPMQREIIDSILSGKDTLALLPTGGGKSLTYQIPAVTQKGICLVVTPLIALMKDQVDRLRQIGVSAIAIHSGLSRRQIDTALDNCIYGGTKLLYVAPERLTSPLFVERLRRMEISLLAIDEAHCISQWGYDFRPSYLRIGDIRSLIPDTPILALTASATQIVCGDIMKNLKFQEEHLIRGSFARRNLSYSVRHVEDKMGMLLRILSRVDGSAIVYARTRKGCEEIAKNLTHNEIPAVFYHGGLAHTDRSLRQDWWLSGEYRVIVATNAFGMGIDKADVRVVVHYSLCDSIEAYYQEAGRAGRDDKRSYAVLLVSPDDEVRVRKSIRSEFPSLDDVKSIYDKVCRRLEVAYGEGGLNYYNFDSRKFCREERIYSGTFMSAIKLLQMNDYLTLFDEMVHPARLIFIVGRDDLYRVRLSHIELDHIIRTILRLYDGVFSDFQPIDISLLSEVSGYTPSQVTELLKQLWRMRLIRYTPSSTSAMIYLSKDRLKESELYISPDSYKHRKELYERRFKHMMDYANSNKVCRSITLSEYFGDTKSRDCGICDVCLEKRRETKPSMEKRASLRDTIRQMIGTDDEHLISIKRLISTIRSATPDQITQEVESMIESGELEVNIAGYLTLK